MNHPMNLTYTIRQNGVAVEDKTFTKSRCNYKKHKLFSRAGWVAYCMFHIGNVKYELHANFKSVLG